MSNRLGGVRDFFTSRDIYSSGQITACSLCLTGGETQNPDGQVREKKVGKQPGNDPRCHGTLNIRPGSFPPSPAAKGWIVCQKTHLTQRCH